MLELLDPVAEAAGFEIVRLRLMGGVSARRLQVMAEREDGTMQVEDCARLARALNPILDAADPVAGDYVLEVSSPGIDRPLTRPKDFVAWEGFEARLEIDRLAEGRKRFKGELAGFEDGLVAINLEGEAETAMLPFDWLVDAKLVITDALLKHGADERAARIGPEGEAALDEAEMVDGEAEPEAAPPRGKPPSAARPAPSSPGKKTKPRRPRAANQKAKSPEDHDHEDQKD